MIGIGIVLVLGACLSPIKQVEAAAYYSDSTKASASKLQAGWYPRRSKAPKRELEHTNDAVDEVFVWAR